MLENCDCPLAAEIPTIPVDDCPVDVGQIQKIILQRRGYSFNPEGGVNDITLGATWTALLAATDSTKIQLTPFTESFVITAGEAITIGGGGNDTLNGVEKVTGVNPSAANGHFASIPQHIAQELKKFMCYKDLVAYYVNEEDKIIAKNVTQGGAATDEIQGFPVQSLFISDLDNQGFGTNDKNMLSFKLKKGWSDGLEKFTPADFSPLNLNTTAS